MLRQIDTSFLLTPEPEKPGEKFNGQGWGYLDPDLLPIRDMWEDLTVLTNNVHTVVEVGMFAGHSTVCLLEYFPFAHVTSIDPGIFSKQAYKPIKDRYGNRFRFIPSTFPLSDFDKIDFLFIDGNHSYEAVTKDIEKALELKPRYILFDNVELPGVRRAIKEKKLFSSFLRPRYWFYTNEHKGETCPGIIMFLDMEGKYDEVLRLL